MNLHQYRGSAFGGWAAGVLATGSGWKVDLHRTDSHWDLEVKTPIGGLFTWVRFW